MADYTSASLLNGDALSAAPPSFGAPAAPTPNDAQDNTPAASQLIPEDRIAAARKAGYSDKDIVDTLKQNTKFNISGALKAGYDYSDILNAVTEKAAPVSATDPAEQSGTVMGWAKGAASGLINSIGQKLTSMDRLGPLSTQALNAEAGIDTQTQQKDMEAQTAALPPDLKAKSAIYDKEAHNIGADVSNFGLGILTPEERERFGVKVTSMIGGFAPYIGAGMAGGLPAIVGLGGIDGYGRGYDEAKAAGQSDDKAQTAGMLTSLVDGGMMAVPLHKAMEVMSILPATAKASALKAVIELAKSSGTMVGFSELSKIADNAVAKNTYDPNRDILEGVGKDVGVEAAAGLIIPISGAGVGKGFDATRAYIDAKKVERDAATSPEQKDVETATDVMSSTNIDSAIDTASVAAETGKDPVADIMGGKAELDKAAPDLVKQDKLVGLFTGLNEGTVKKDGEDYLFHTKTEDGEATSVPLRVWDPAAATDDGKTIPPELAQAQVDHYGKLGVDVVYFENDANIPFDGAVDPKQPNTIFLSNDPSRNEQQVAAHEVTHVLENVTLPDGETLADVMHGQIAEGVTNEGLEHAYSLFGDTAPDRNGFAADETGQAAHADAVMKHLFGELGADIGGEAPKFNTFFPKVMDAIEQRYGQGVVTEVLQKFMDGIKSAVATMRKFFGTSDENTQSQRWVSNLEQIHDTLADAYAAKYGESGKLPEFTRMRPSIETAPSTDVSRSGPAPGANYADAKVKAANYQKFINDLDTKRREDAKTAPDVRLLQQSQAAILKKVGGVETKLTKVAAVRLENIRAQIDARLNPVGDSPDMARVREAMVREHQRMADATAVSKQPEAQFSPRKRKEEISQPGVDVSSATAHGFAPSLRVKVNNPPKFELNKKGEPVALMMQTTTNGNAVRQIEHLDTILQKFPDATSSSGAWSQMMAYALGSDEVPIPSYAFIRDLNSDGAEKKVSSLSAGQISDANHGFEQAAAFRKAYESGKVSPVTTGKLFLWSFLSRGVSTYVQEGLFIDAFDGAAPWIKKAVDGNFAEADLPAYEEWARSAAPKGSGQPGAGATHNLNAFGTNFLLRMSQRDADGSSHLSRLHDMMSDPTMTGQKIRREFMKFGEAVGIDNKVVSFTMLVAGHSDVMVIDRVQTRQLWDDGRFEDVNIYDGQKNAEGKVITGTPLSNLTYGVRGLLAYEAIERGLGDKINEIYDAAGRPQDASVGRYHWESWVAYSEQEASHGTLQAILNDAIRPGDRSAIANVTAKQGEYGAYEYGARYGRDGDGAPFFRYTTPLGQEHEFSVPAFRAFLDDIKRPATGVVPTKFKVTESGNGPWYDRPEVNQSKLDAVAVRWADRSDREGALLRPAEGRNDADRPRSSNRSAQPDAAGVQFSPKRDDEGFLTARRLRADRAGDAGSSVSYTRSGGRGSSGTRVLDHLGVSYDAEWKAGSGLRKDYEAMGAKVPLRLLELKQGDPKNAEAFKKAITAAKEGSKFGAAVAVYPKEDYAGFRLLLSDNGKSGVAIKPDGDIVSVFSTDKTGRAIMEAAVAAGGRKLDAFDTTLPKFYHDFGFVEAGRTKWNDEYAPEGWSKETYKNFNDGKPDVVLMVLDRNDTSPILEKSEVYNSWDEAAAAQEKMLKQLDKETPGSVINLRLDRLDGGEPFTVSQAKELVEQTGAQVIASRTRKIPGKEGEPGVVFHLSRPLSKVEANSLALDLKQDAIPQYANNRGDMHGPNTDKYGTFDPSKFHILNEEMAAASPRISPKRQAEIIQKNPNAAGQFRKPVEITKSTPKEEGEPPSTKKSALTIADDHAADVRALETDAQKAAAKKHTPQALRQPQHAAPEPANDDKAKTQRALTTQHPEGKGRKIERALNDEETRTLENKPQQERAAALVDKDPEKALRVAMRQEQPPKDLLPTFVYFELERRATRDGDEAMIEKLRSSPLAKEITTAARTVQSFSTRDPQSAVAKIQEIEAAREAQTEQNVKGEHGSLDNAKVAEAEKAAPQIKKNIKEQIKARPISDWAAFADSLRCK